ncbi:hepatitis A virus cellular receptor 1 homolog [Grammomys surdaster]|uniref:hepatitis A virus cellular receptor 1 homolog n=1 Tax=Grammomys surdaster TaxID=491861 RepID=UPI00109F957F|nr:hepatitis A virus cellular receptor 1 homolog [Grammomys surdaster]
MYLLIVLQVTIMMPPQVLISGLLLLSAAVESFPEVHGVVGHSVTLPCIYPVSTRRFYMCWGRGPCNYNTCGERIIATDGYQIQYRASNRYQLKGQLLQGIGSLTILNLTVSDSGHYCCGLQMKGWYGIVEIMTSLLLVQPEIPTNPPTRPTTTGRPTTPGRPMTISTRFTHVSTSTRISTSTPPTPAHMQTHKPDWNNTVTSSDDTWNNSTEVIPSWKPQKTLTKGFYVGISIAALLLLLLVSTVVITRFIIMKKKSGSLSFSVSKSRPLPNIKVVVKSKDEDKFYIIEDTPNPEEQSQWPSEGPSA